MYKMDNLSNSTKSKGGIFKGNSHTEGGIDFIIPETQQRIEVEGDEPLISADALSNPNIYEYYGDNFKILNTINKSVGAKGLSEKATQVHAGDVIICKKTLWDKTKKTLKGTNKQVISAINTEAGCAVIEIGATITDDNGNTKQFKDGGKTKTNNSAYHQIIDATIPYQDEMIEKYIEYWNKKDKPPTKYDIDMYRLSLIMDLSKAIGKYLKSDDIVNKLDITSDKGVITISCNLLRGGEQYWFITEMIYAGGYNIQVLHYRYIVKTKLPNLNTNTEYDKLNDKYKKLSKIERLNNDLKYQNNILKRYELELDEQKENAKLSDEQIKNILIKTEIDGVGYLRYTITWAEIVRRGADVNYDFSEEEFNNRKLDDMNKSIQSFKNSKANVSYSENNVKLTKKSINKIISTISDLEDSIKFEYGGSTEKRYVAEADFYIHADSDVEAEKEAKEIAHELDQKYQNRAMVNHLTEKPFGGIGNSRVVFKGGGELPKNKKLTILVEDLYKDHHEAWAAMAKISKEVCEDNCKTCASAIIIMWEEDLVHHFTEEETEFFPTIKTDKNSQIIDDLLEQHKWFLIKIGEMKINPTPIAIKEFCDKLIVHIKLEEYLMSKIIKDPYKKPKQTEVVEFFESTNRELHYLYDKPVKDWDDYDLSNWNAKMNKQKFEGGSEVDVLEKLDFEYLTELQRFNINKVAKEYEDKIRNQEILLKTLIKQKNKAIKKANNRCGLFGDTEADEKQPNLFEVELNCDKENHDNITKPFEGKIRIAKDEIQTLKSNMNHELDAIISQSELFKNGGLINNNDYLPDEKYQDVVDKIKAELEKRGKSEYYNGVSKSETDYGKSWYVKLRNKNEDYSPDYDLQVRISDHSVQSMNRIMNGQYVKFVNVYDDFTEQDAENTINIFLDALSQIDSKKQRRVDAFQKLEDRGKYINEKSIDFLESVKSHGKAIFFHSFTRLNLDEIKKRNPTAENIFQKDVNGGYEYYWVNKNNGYGKFYLEPEYFNFLIDENVIDSEKVEGKITYKDGGEVTDSNLQKRLIIAKKMAAKNPDLKSRVKVIELMIKKLEKEKKHSPTEFFNLPIPKTLIDVERGVDDILSQYSGRPMANIQVNSYLNEHSELGKKFLVNHNILNKAQLEKHLSGRQSKLRQPILAERKKENQEFENEKAKIHVSVIEKMALEQGAAYDELVEKSDKKLAMYLKDYGKPSDWDDKKAVLVSMDMVEIEELPDNLKAHWYKGKRIVFKPVQINKTVQENWNDRIFSIDTEKEYKDITQLKVGDVILTKDGGLGFVKKINDKNVVYETTYKKNGEAELMELKTPKENIAIFKKPR